MNTSDGDEMETFEAYGFRCTIVRVLRHMPWCGYVHVPAGHPWHGKDPDGSIHVVGIPGGITYCAPDPDTGEWTVGFDLGHVSIATEHAEKSHARGYTRFLSVQAATAGAEWSGDRPTSEGAFWWRLGPSSVPQLARVDDPYGEGLEHELWDDYGGMFVRLHDDCLGQWAKRVEAVL